MLVYAKFVYMTLIVATICPEGIALAADSKCSIEKEVTDSNTGEQHIEASGFVTTSNKLMLSDNNVGIAVQGMAMINGLKANLHIQDFMKAHQGLDASQMTTELVKMLRQEGITSDMRLYVAGYVVKQGTVTPCLYLIDSAPQWSISEHNNYAAYWIGETDVMDRLFEMKLVKLDNSQKPVRLPIHLFPIPTYSLQDAIDFSVLGVEMTYRVMRFQDRAQTVGPPIDVLAITKDGAMWVQKKEISVTK
jgi:hypothetical protein